MIPPCFDSQLVCCPKRLASDYKEMGRMKTILGLFLVLATASTALAAAKPKITSPLTATGQAGVAFSYPITADQTITTWGAAGLPAGLTVNTTTGLISGTPAWGTNAASPYSVTLSATNGNGTGTATLVLTILPPPTAFVGFRLPDFLMAAGTPNKPRLMLQMGATSTTVNPFNVTLEVDATGTGTWVPYNHFVGITDTNPNYAFRASWITDAPLPVRDSGALTGAPQAFATTQLTQPALPAAYIKADPRSTRFGIFQMDTNPTDNSRIIDSVWPLNSSTFLPNGYGGAVATTFPGPVEHAPLRFAGQLYYPGTFCIDNGVTVNPSPPPRYTQATSYADNDGVVRPADATYADPSVTTTGSSTPYNTSDYRPIILNRPFRNVAELGYAFRDLPWKTLDFFSENSADAGLLDAFSVNDEPAMVAGRVNLNTQQASGLQAILAGAIWNEISSSIVNSTGTPATQTALAMATNIANATSATPMTNKSEIITRAGLPRTILPVPGTTPTPSPTPIPTATPLSNQTVKARREVVPRAISSVSQTRVWNVLIDVVAQSGRYKPNATSLQNDFIVEGEQHYWVHVAIDRFTGQVIDKQIEVVNE